MRSFVDRLANYATYHRDRRNIATHFVGIPMVVLGTQALLAKVGIGPLNLATAATAAAASYYRKLDPEYGKAMTVILGASCTVATGIAALPLPIWAATSGTLFIGGWAFQFLGHKLEGKKPAFADDIADLLTGPLFIVAEAAFALGFSHELREQIEAHAGPSHWGHGAAIEHVPAAASA
jgi:uncharacterized membrane protein YGL010W